MGRKFTIITEDEEVIYELASFGKRFLARIIDTLIVIIPNSIIPLIPGWLYWAFTQSSAAQATVGQRALNIVVVDKQGKTISFGTASIRFFGNFLNVFTLFIGFLMMLFNDKGQCLHDLVAGTIVVNKEPLYRTSKISAHLIDPETL